MRVSTGFPTIHTPTTTTAFFPCAHLSNSTKTTPGAGAVGLPAARLWDEDVERSPRGEQNARDKGYALEA